MKKIKEKVLKAVQFMEGVIKTKLTLELVGVVLALCLIMCLFGSCGKVDKVEYKKVVNTNKQLETDNAELTNENNKANEKLDKTKEELKNIQTKTKEYRTLNEEEKAIVDAKIQEVKEATKQQKEAEKKALEEEKARIEAEKKAEEERKAQEEQAKREAEEQAKREAEAHKYETGLTWEDIAREGKYGILGQFEGKILQVMNGTGFKQYRVAINGDYNQVMLIQVNNGVSTETLLEDDYVYFKGQSLGTVTYKTVLGAEMTVPAFKVDEITR